MITQTLTDLQMMSFRNRKPKADIAKLFIGVTSRDKNNLPKTVVVPGSSGKQYQVIIRRPKIGLVELECRLIAGNLGYIDCKGNSLAHTLCYHSRAAFEFIAAETNRSVRWCVDEEDAKRLPSIYKYQEPMIYKVKSRQSGAVAIALVFNNKRR